MDGWARPSAEAAFAGEHRPDPLLRAQPLHPILTRTDAAVTEFVGDEAVAERGVAGVDVTSRVD